MSRTSRALVVEMDYLDSINRSLELTIMPTEKCNFDCYYCYEDFEIGKMERRTVDSVKEFLSHRIPDLDHLSIGWFGGEPLLGYDIMLEVMEHVNVKRLENQNLKVVANTTTNGYLLDQKRLESLVKFGANNFQITLDGDKGEHDKLRVRRDGKGTFDDIWKNLLGAHRTDLDFSIMLRLHVNRDNIASMEKLIARIKNEMGGDSRFVLFIRELSKLGGKNDENLPILEGKTAVEHLISSAKMLGLRVHDSQDDFVCYASKPNAYVIRSDGSLSKCTVELYSDHNIIGRILPGGTMEIDSEKSMLWSRGMFSGNKEELACPAINFPKEMARDSYKKEEYRRKLKVL